jgi:triosephosphate isomerase (TIM)
MSRPSFICANWKMNTTLSEALDLSGELVRLVGRVRRCDIMIAPPYPYLAPISKKLQDSQLMLGAQDLYPESKGAFTGAVSGPMLKSVGVDYVLVGHSERRQIFGESLDSSHRRLVAALSSDLSPIVCVGENMAERDAGQTNDVVGRQLEAALGDLGEQELATITIAYEPVWAIGTGKVASPGMAQEVHAAIRERLRYRSTTLATSIRLLYGGSVKPDNARELLSQSDIDGALVGGASLKADSFVGIIKAAIEVS